MEGGARFAREGICLSIFQFSCLGHCCASFFCSSPDFFVRLTRFGGFRLSLDPSTPSGQGSGQPGFSMESGYSVEYLCDRLTATVLYFGAAGKPRHALHGVGFVLLLFGDVLCFDENWPLSFSAAKAECSGSTRSITKYSSSIPSIDQVFCSVRHSLHPVSGHHLDGCSMFFSLIFFLMCDSD